MKVSTTELTKEHRDRISKHIRMFNKYAKTEDFKRDMKDREERSKFYQSLSKERLQFITEFELGEIISRLWASQLWGNKEYLVQKLLADNTLDTIKEKLSDLLWGEDPIERRYEGFLRRVKGLGPASITELLSHVHPTEGGIWNDKARKALRILGFEDTLPLNKYRITGEEYKQFNEVVQVLASILQKAGFAEADLLFVDYFLYEIWSSEKSKEKSNLDLGAEFDHDEIQHQIEQIGFWLGFETEVEKLVSPGAVVDVIWRAKIANLGVVTYVFEVHKSGSIDSLILNLQKARNNPTVQKVVAISDRPQLDKIQREIRGLPEDFRKALTFWDAIDVQRAYQNLSEVSEIIAQLELVKGEFPE